MNPYDTNKALGMTGSSYRVPEQSYAQHDQDLGRRVGQAASGVASFYSGNYMGMADAVQGLNTTGDTQITSARTPPEEEKKDQSGIMSMIGSIFGGFTGGGGGGGGGGGMSGMFGG